MSVALLSIATGPVYWNYVRDMVSSARKHWPTATNIVFTDDFYGFAYADVTIWTEPKGYPNETLMRYHTFLAAEKLLSKFEHIFYCDADMLWVAPPEDILYDGLVATYHPGYYGRKGTPETRRESTAFCDWNTAYYCGGFQGGASVPYLEAMRTMRARIDADTKRGITAIWHDESHWNAYLASCAAPVKFLSPSYCYPEDYDGRWGWQPDEFKPILLALDKRKRQGRG